MTGTIKTLKTGFGFIKSPEGQDYFFHHSSLIDVHFEELVEGTKVQFDVEDGNRGKGPRATNVKLMV